MQEKRYKYDQIAPELHQLQEADNKVWRVAKSTDAGSRVATKLRSFAALPAGWCHGEGSPIPADTIDTALDLIGFLQKHSIIDLDTFPGLNGEIQITAYAENEIFLEVTINTPESFNFVIEDADDEELVSDFGITLETTKKLIAKNKFLFFPSPNRISSWGLHESSVYITMTKPNEGLPVLHLNHLQMAEFRLFAEAAL